MNKVFTGLKYSSKPSIIPVKVNKKTVTTMKFEPNLNLSSGPSYVNEGGNIGLARVPKGKYKDKLVFMYEDNYFPSRNYAEFISENDAYDLCISRGKNMIIKKLDIHPDYEEEQDEG